MVSVFCIRDHTKNVPYNYLKSRFFNIRTASAGGRESICSERLEIAASDRELQREKNYCGKRGDYVIE
jgi:hypothetical protein